MNFWRHPFRVLLTLPTFFLSFYLAVAACPAWGVAVDVPLDEVTVNLGLLLQVGHYYEYRKGEPYSYDDSRFDLRDAEVAVRGTVFEKVTYALRSYRFSSIREGYVGVEPGGGFSAAVGYIFVPFGAEATTYERDLTCSSRTNSSENIAPGRDYGLRLGYELRREQWPYVVGAAAGIFNSDEYSRYTIPVMAGAGRVYGTPLPGLRSLQTGFSYYYDKTYRYKLTSSTTSFHNYLEEPRVGVDVAFSLAAVTFSAEYLQRFLNDYPIEARGFRWPPYVYKDAYDRGYFGTVTYHRKLRWRYFQGIQPYVRYERWKPAVILRGVIPERRFTGGLALLFLGRNLMFRSDYTRVVEDAYPTTNDRIASEFQVSF